MTKIGFFIKSNDYTLLIFILEVLSGSQKSEVHIPQSKIRNPQSTIRVLMGKILQLVSPLLMRISNEVLSGTLLVDGF